MKKIKTSLIMNILIVIFVTLGTIFMFTGFRFMPGPVLLEANKLEMFKFYTVDSNILMGLSSLLLLFYEFRLLRGKIKEIPNAIYIIKQIGVTSVSLTFLVTAIFLMPRFGFFALYNNSNLIFHLIVPILALVSYIFFEKHNNKYRYALYGIIPTILYSIYYTSEIIIHLNNGGLTYKYDFYGFLAGSIKNIYISIPAFYIIVYLISIIIIKLNIKANQK